MIEENTLTVQRHTNRNNNRKGKHKDKHESRTERGNTQLKDEGYCPSSAKLPPVQAFNEEQAHYLKLLKDPNINIVIIEGYFGTGKSYLAAVIAADALKDKEIDKVIVARPYVQTGKSSGAKPGSSLEKLYPYVRNILDTMKKRLGEGYFKYCLRDGLTGTIEVQELESIRGRSFDEPSFVIIDEAQQSNPDEMLSIVTRISDNCTLVLCGDDSQRDIRGLSGLAWFKKFATDNNLPNVGYVNFDKPEHIVRGGVARAIALAIAENGRGF